MIDFGIHWAQGIKNGKIKLFDRIHKGMCVIVVVRSFIRAQCTCKAYWSFCEDLTCFKCHVSCP